MKRWLPNYPFSSNLEGEEVLDATVGYTEPEDTDEPINDASGTNWFNEAIGILGALIPAPDSSTTSKREPLIMDDLLEKELESQRLKQKQNTIIMVIAALIIISIVILLIIKNQ